MITKQCKCCSETFKTNRRWQLTCSKKCKAKNKSGVYIIEFETGIKVGCSVDIDQRIYEQYARPWCHPIKRMTKLLTVKGDHFKLETMILRLLSDKGKAPTSQEFFIDCPYDDIVEVAFKAQKDICK